MIVLKGYDENGEVWAIGKKYAKETLIFRIEPTKEIIQEFERLKNVFNNTREKKRIYWRADKKQ